MPIRRYEEGGTLDQLERKDDKIKILEDKLAAYEKLRRTICMLLCIEVYSLDEKIFSTLSDVMKKKSDYENLYYKSDITIIT